MGKNKKKQSKVKNVFKVATKGAQSSLKSAKKRAVVKKVFIHFVLLFVSY